MKSKRILFVYKDETEDWARVFNSLEKALAYINHEFKYWGASAGALFELGDEIKFVAEKRLEPQESKVSYHYKAR